MRHRRWISRVCGVVLSGVPALAWSLGCASSTERAPAPASPEPASPARQYELRIDSVPARGAVAIDGQPAGQTPVVRRFDAPAAVVIEVTAPGHATAVLRTDANWWLRSAAAAAAERLGRSVVIRSFRPQLEPVVLLEVVSDPPGSTVTINGEEQGQTPLAMRWDGAKPMSVRVARARYADYTTTIDARWWDEHAPNAKLDAAAGAYTTTVSAKLFPSDSMRWKRVAHTSSRGKGKSKGRDKRGGTRDKKRASRSKSAGQKLEISGPTLSGGQFDLGQYKGKVVLVDFWASWCGPCREEAPNVLNVYNQYHKGGFEVVGVNLDKSKVDAANFVKQLGMPWPQIFFDRAGSRGWENPLARKYNVRSIPSMYLIDRNGTVAEQGVRGAALGPAVAKLLNQ